MALAFVFRSSVKRAAAVLLVSVVLVVQAMAQDSSSAGALPAAQRQLTLSDDQLSWTLDWTDGQLRSLSFDNKLSQHPFAIEQSLELALNFSAKADQVAQPFQRADDFQVRKARQVDARHVIVDLRSKSLPIDASLHIELDGPTRRKWVEVTNRGTNDLLLLDVELDDLTVKGKLSGGGQGEPVYLDDEVFAAIEHPAGDNEGKNGHIELAHFPGKRLPPAGMFKSYVALVSMAPKRQAREAFVNYIQARSIRPRKVVSVFTPFGINNQWGGCPALDDEQVLDVLSLLKKWQKKGVYFDYFTLDTGWVDPNSDLTRFRPTCYPEGPGKMVDAINSLGMNFGLWFGTSWGTQSCWDYPPAYANGRPPGLPYREGYPLTAGGITFCFASKPYYDIVKKAVLYHIRENHARLLKFDGGDYFCNSTDHGHLPGKYSVEAMFSNLIDLAQSARAAAPDVFIIWYWGLHSPFWAMYGDMVFESGLEMEGSGTSAVPTLYYRDSVTLAQDQNAQFAANIPPITKDSLGTWLAETRWGNFMGKDRWREALVMDLGRGSMLFPNIWGDPYLLNDEDLDFLAWISQFAKRNQTLFLHRKNILGSPFQNEVYGYAHCDGARGALFLNNDDFESREAKLRLDSSIGLDAKPGTRLRVVSQFPERVRLTRDDGAPLRIGDTLDIWLRPFEVLMVEINSEGGGSTKWQTRKITADAAAGFSRKLALQPSGLGDRMNMTFADEQRFAAQGFKKKVYSYDTTLPALPKEHPMLAIAVRLRKGGAEWRYKPTVVQIVQALVRIGDQDVQLLPVPESRQYGNTQSFGCSWVVFKVRLNPKWSGKPVKLAVHAWLPDGVDAQIDGWVIECWWEENTRPTPDGYYTDAPS